MDSPRRRQPRTADRVIEKIHAEINGLREFPGKGHSRADVKQKEYRFWTVYSYLIIYRYDEQTLKLIRVVHGRRNIRALLRAEPK